MQTRPAIAIVGIGNAFPSAMNPEQFWENIIAGKDCSREPPEKRWSVNIEDVYASSPKPDRVNSKKACFIDDFELDLDGLAIEKQLIEALDPMFRVLLHAGSQAWKDCQTGNLNRKRTGIIIGNIALPTDYSSRLAEEVLDQIITSTKPSGLAACTVPETHPLNRYIAGLPGMILARSLGLKGPSYTLDAACASSLYSLKYAIDELQSGRMDAMLCGGLSRPDSLYTQMGFSTLGAISSSGRCSPFDYKADGLVVGEGSGILVIKRLEDALRDKDHIYATVAGIGLSNDIKGNLMLPDSEGQLRAMRAAYREAGWSPEEIDLIECHGTGTPTGDRTEFNSMLTLWEGRQSAKQKCVIGSVKSNVGHLLTAAGSAGLIKTLMALKNKQLPPMANFESQADGISLETGPFRVLSRPDEWSPRKEGVTRKAAVSAFGFGGINAHVLLEEYDPDLSAIVSNSRQKDIKSQIQQDSIAIIGMETHFGPWDSKDKYLQRVFGVDHQTQPVTANNRWGNQKLESIPGFLINQIDIPLGRYRIPPKELEDMLPQQLLMLNVAANALDNAGLDKISDEHRDDVGIFIGIGLDLNTTNFHLRWSITDKLNSWAAASNWVVDQNTLYNWTEKLKDQVSPPLSANRTMGALGGIVASRIARAFNIGGPSFTVSSEEASGMNALELAVRSLQKGELNMAIAGAVDLCGDVRSVYGQNKIKPYSTPIGEGAVAFILKRYADAVKDGDQVYAVINGLSSKTGGDNQAFTTAMETYQDCINDACRDANVSIDEISFIELHGNGNPEDDDIEFQALNTLLNNNYTGRVLIGSVMNEIGQTGAASGLASVARAALSLQHNVLPPYKHRHKQPILQTDNHHICWTESPQLVLSDKHDNHDHILVSSMSIGGNCSHVILGKAREEVLREPAVAGNFLHLQSHDALFSIDANDKQGILQGINRLNSFVDSAGSDNIQEIAAKWFSKSDKSKAKLSLNVISINPAELKQHLFRARSLIESSQSVIEEKIFYTDKPLSKDQKLAFVFPGSGNHFTGMGQDIACRWPNVIKDLENENTRLRSQFASSKFWQQGDNSPLTHEQAIFAQVWLGTFISDVITSFQVKPDAIIGYSLGETAGLFATRTWTDRDLMLERMEKSSLFKSDLAGKCDAVRKTWGLSGYVDVDWLVGVVNCPANIVEEYISSLPWIYRLITNTPDECVIGGHRIAVESLVKELRCVFHTVEAITTVHCEVATPVYDAYRELHLFPTNPPENVSFYSCIKGGEYNVTTDSAADSIVDMAIKPFDFNQVINAAYEDNVRLFIEMGPGASCTRMIDSILGTKPHVSHAVCVKGKNGILSVLQTLAILKSHGVDLDLSSLYQDFPAQQHDSLPDKVIMVKTGHGPLNIEIPFKPRVQDKPEEKRVSADIIPHPAVPMSSFSDSEVVEQMLKTESARALTHETFLRISNGINQSLSQALSLQMKLLDTGGMDIHVSDNLHSAPKNWPTSKDLFMDRQQCLEFATGSIAKVLGEQFNGIDDFPTRVRLPDEPLMLVDRILEVEGEPGSMTSGRVVTEHDIHPGAWYLDGNRIPTCIAVESGQADLFLSGYMGIDKITKGLAVYRLLDAEITFHGPLPVPGKTIHYDIRIDHFFKQGDTHLFRFSFDGTVDDKPLLTMRNGCAGFFTQSELDAGKGIVQTALELQPQAGKKSDDWIELVPMGTSPLDDSQLNALRHGDLISAFGETFKGLPINTPVKLPSGRMTLVHRVLDIEPGGGRFGMGTITGEADIHPDDWFLTCHFVDDMVMPGTLMYECCLHTLRIYLMRLGWVGEADEFIYEPIPGVTSKLKCRGQVIATTKKVQYEIIIKEIGYQSDGTPYVIADALMYADNRPIVQMSNMSTRLSGLTRERLLEIWSEEKQPNKTNPVLFDYDSIFAFATGKPSDAFGERYKPFDKDRIIARLPGPPYQFLDRIISIKDCEQWVLKPGGRIIAEYDVPTDAWYFQENRQGSMPFSVLLEVALQPCGWLAAYLGSALTSDVDLSFRNLGGKAEQFLLVTPDTGTLTTHVTITQVSTSGGMIIQNFDYEVKCIKGTVYKGDTYFGFFSKQALSNQVGIREAELYQPTDEEITRASKFSYPDSGSYPAEQMRMVDTITHYDPEGGPVGLGFIKGTAKVKPDAWFFKAHFYQDPVWPGSLGLESFIQLLKVFAIEKWGDNQVEFESMAKNQPHEWLYRGQIIPVDDTVTVEAVIKHVDNQRKMVTADGFLSVDGRTIYQMKDFTLRI